MTITIDRAQVLLEQIAETLPAELYKDLNGGILLLPQEKISPYAVGDDLYILGEYQSGGSMGRLIKIYYGSFEKLFGSLSEEEFKERLKKTLFHEFTHHLESLAGERDLEIEDERQLAAYRREKGV
ncbi:metallopeptidase family protein [Mogibacterium sp. BX12]|uniref:Metallopeptidase family protein n=1 Tax=Zhenpiania hominis TaxID=2763644 RepID=A0A923NKE3_9FIRM|nr:metallopeptidase family protein [Zhenpiania hominis]